MPPVSPCGRVVDFLRTCSTGFWRFDANKPDVLTPGYHYFVDDDTRAIQSPHSFGDNIWNKDGLIYPEYPTGMLRRAGRQWYNGEPPLLIPPDQQIFTDGEFGNSVDMPASPAVAVRGGFDARCFVVGHPGVDIDVDDYIRPDVTDCCWQRVLARLLELLSSDDPNALTTFTAAVNALWHGYTIDIHPLDSVVYRFALIVGPTYQMVLRVGTQSWAEIFSQSFHLLQPSRNQGPFSTSNEWFRASTELVDFLELAGWNPEKPCIFAGHSQGAVILWILARRMMAENANRVIDFLSFGVPKPGDSRLVDQDGIRNVRHVRHREDIVPLVPPRSVLFPRLNDVLFWLDAQWLGTWESFRLYQITGEGAGMRMEGPIDAGFETIVSWLTDAWQGNAPEPIQQHYLSSYVAALAACCHTPGAPFTPEFWGILFGIPDNAFGGLMIGPHGVRPWEHGSGGLAIGGGLPYFYGRGGLEIGGAGTIKIETTDAVLLESGWYVLLESGDLIDLE